MLLNTEKLKKICKKQKTGVGQLADHLVRAGLDKKAAVSALRNWQRRMFKPVPTKEDISKLAAALSVEPSELTEWKSSYRYAPGSPRKAKLVAQLIQGRRVQDAMDVLKFTRKRAAPMVDKILRTAVADADEQQADVDNLYVSSAVVDDAGVRVGTKQWRAKDRGRAHSIKKKACHIHVTVAQI